MGVFRFKQFSVEQELTAMKVGTDGVLLGAWVHADQNIKNILDIGTGTGVIALMLAQKYQKASIEAIEIEFNAYRQALINVENSDFNNRIQVKHIALQNFIPGNKKAFDLIVCNPPYFSKGWKIENAARKVARDAEHLPNDLLISIGKNNLTRRGSLQLIFPCAEGEIFMKEAVAAKLFCRRITSVQTKPNMEPKRWLMEFVRYQANMIKSNLIIETDAINTFTPEYKELTRDFYLKF